MNRKLTAALLIAAAVLGMAAFTGLGSVFNYPDVLNEPAGDVLAEFRDSQGVVSGWFLVLAAAAALFVPIAIGVGRLSRPGPCASPCRWGSPPESCRSIGLLRWPLLVPGYAADAASTDPATVAGGPGLLRHRQPDPRHRDRRELRLRPHRRLDPARHRRPPPLASPAAGSASSARSPPCWSSPVCSHPWTCPSSTPPTSPATSCGACGSSPSACCSSSGAPTAAGAPPYIRSVSPVPVAGVSA